MTKTNLLEAFKLFSEEATADLILPVQQQKEDKEVPLPRAPEAHIMALTDYRSCKKKAPYMIHQRYGRGAVAPGAMPGLGPEQQHPGPLLAGAAVERAGPMDKGEQPAGRKE